VNDRAMGVAFWTGSVTPFEENNPNNPSFRRFILDEETMLPVAVETYVMDLTDLDQDEVPSFVLDHELSEFFGMPDLSPSSFDDLSNRLLTTEDIAHEYQLTKSNHGLNLTRGNTCDQECRATVYC